MTPTAHGWMPVAGAFACGTWSDPTLAQIASKGHSIVRTEQRMLPLYMRNRAHRLPPEDKLALDTLLEKYAGAGHITRWNWETGGYPTTISALDVLTQAGGKRVIMDARYTNGGIQKVPLDLPSAKYICSRIGKGDHLAKFDLKTGYHQLRLREEDHGAMCFEWRGAIWNFNVVTLGTRDAPGTFQRMTRFIGDQLERRFGIKVEVYLDDFICIAPNGVEPPAIDAVIAEITSFGAVLGADKCSKEWSTEIEVLGFVVNSESGAIGVTRKKRAEAFELLGELQAARSIEAKKLAVTIGKIQHLQDAVRHLFSLMRPIVNNLIVHENGRVTPAELTKARITGCERYHPRGTVQLHEGATVAAAIITRRWDQLTPRNFREKREVVTIATDASDLGIGAVYVPGGLTAGDEQLRGKIFAAEGLPRELLCSSSMKRETYAMLRAIEIMAEQPERIRGKAIHVLTDNASLYSRGFRGYRDEVATQWLVRCAMTAIDAGAELAAISWIPRSRNTLADSASRQVKGWGAELQVDIRWYARWLKAEIAGKLPVPNVDVFAAPDARLMLRYVTVTKATAPPWPVGVDAFAVEWEADDVLWAFPPPPLARKAWQMWKGSKSTAMYLCVPKPTDENELTKLIAGRQQWEPVVLREKGFTVALFVK
jgi:hypothetical protein